MDPETFPWADYKSEVLARLDFREIYAEIEKARPSGDGWMLGLCPFHEDHEPSFAFSTTMGGWKCHAGCGQGSVFDFLVRQFGKPFKDVIFELGDRLGVPRPTERQEIRMAQAAPPAIPEELVLRWHQHLLDSEELRSALQQRRGISGETVRRFKLGWDENRRRYALPIRDEGGTVVNVRLASLETTPKMLNYTSNGHRYGSPPRLFGIDLLAKLNGRQVVLCEGEWDRLLLEQVGFAALTGTHGAGTFPEVWASHFAGKDVAVLYDRDVTGRRAAKRIVRHLASAGAASVRDVVLPLKGTAEEKDVSDYFLRHLKNSDDLQTLIDQTPIYSPAEPSVAVSGNESWRQPETLTDSGNAARLRRLHGEDFRWVTGWGKYVIWDGRRWTAEGAEVRLLAATIEVARDLLHQASECEDADLRKALTAAARGAEAASRRRAMIELFKAEPGIAIPQSAFDAHDWLLNVENGTIDLRTGTLSPHARDDLITCIAPTRYEEGAYSELWSRFVPHIVGGCQRMAEYLQRAIGYAATGSVREQCLFLLLGLGANGKTTFLNAVRGTLGSDYTCEAPPDLLMAKRGETHPTERAHLFGKRLVTTVEVQEGRRLDEVAVKQLTGGDLITARRMREDFWSFRPTHTLFLAANHRPEVWGTDHAIWRRLRLIPFEVSIPKEDQDRRLPEKLHGERSAILAWTVQGAKSWHEHGLHDPASVMQATEDYRTDQDVLGPFISDTCVLEPDAWAKAGDLYAAFQRWGGKGSMSQKSFGRQLAQRGFRSGKERQARVWYGLRLVEEGGTDGTH